MATSFAQTYFYGTKVDLKIGDLIQAGFQSNQEDRQFKYMYVKYMYVMDIRVVSVA
ncbi:NAD(+)--rifampin ADP-ribosyltransferase [Sphingobacterium faecium]|nr:NAD(+)--rifampin ADP-ribosyltransferase [Sphingobacterium faecium]UXD71749.1 NAD(+)--rifampin ADP-ribosyltransferase [Sphingobacterium faecium]WGQ14712.1 NAD(+)--rifampin ADP-ribosyltransferase [Sphingobacterium faecium]